MADIFEKLSLMGIVPVVRLEEPGKAAALGKALISGGLPCAEITFRTAGADESIRMITEKYPEMLIGAGTVLTVGQVDQAIAAGAKFIVSPGLNEAVVRYCIGKGIPVIPGCANPSDIERAIGLGLDVVKFFPAEAMGGLKTIKAMSAPYGNIRFMPTGGISADNLNDYLSFPKVVACGGSWMVKEDLIRNGKFDEITALTRQSVEQMLGFTLAHVGISADGSEQADAVVGAFPGLLGFAKKETPVSFPTGSTAEVMMDPAPGSKGDIGISTSSVERAAYHLRAKGCRFNEQSARYDGNGKMHLIYFADQIGGFAVHLVQKEH